MTIERPASLHEVRTRWLRVKSEVAYVKMLFAGRQWVEALLREEQKYREDQPRVPSGNGRESGRWTDEGGGGSIGSNAGDARNTTASSPASNAPIVIAGNEGPKILGRGARDFGQRVNTPSPKDINVRMGHIIENHTLGGSGFRTSTRDGGNKTMFPENMKPQDIERAVRQAYSNSREVRSPQLSPDGKIRLLEGESGGLTIRMYYNSVRKEIESAFPRR